VEESGFTTHIPSAHILVAHVFHALHKDEEAARHMEEARRIGTETEIPIGVWLSYMTEAYFHLERNEDASAIAPLKKCLQIGLENGMAGTTLWLPAMFEKSPARHSKRGSRSTTSGILSDGTASFQTLRIRTRQIGHGR